MSQKIEVNYNDLLEASVNLQKISMLLKEAEYYYIKAGLNFVEDYEGKGVGAFGTLLKSITENMDKLSTYYKMTGKSIIYAIEEFSEIDMNEASRISEDFSTLSNLKEVSKGER